MMPLERRVWRLDPHRVAVVAEKEVRDAQQHEHRHDRRDQRADDEIDAAPAAVTHVCVTDQNCGFSSKRNGAGSRSAW